VKGRITGEILYYAQAQHPEGAGGDPASS